LGGSTAQRLLACPASYLEAQKSPISDVSSSYADEGTMLHTVVSWCVQHKKRVGGYMAWAKQGSGSPALTEEQQEVINDALDALTDLQQKYAGEKPWRVIALEEMLQLPGVIGAFGSVDLVATNDVAVIVADWKFGAGIPVKALYTMPDGSLQLNAQAAFYACAARGKYKRHFKNKTIVCAIIQPRLEPHYSYTDTDEDELDGFIHAFGGAVLEALSRDAYRERGEHCRFAPCKSTCILWTGPVIDLSILMPTKPALQQSVDPRGNPYGKYLSQAMDLVEMAETWATEIRRQAHVYLEDGGAVPNWKLVPKRATRQWKEPKEVPALLRTAGALDEDIFTKPELKSVKQVEDSLKPKKIALPAELYQSISSGTTIAHADDARPESTHGMVIENVRKALKALG